MILKQFKGPFSFIPDSSKAHTVQFYKLLVEVSFLHPFLSVCSLLGVEHIVRIIWSMVSADLESVSVPSFEFVNIK